MWLIFGSIAIIGTVINLYLYKKGENYHFAMAVGLSFTALTLVANYSMVASWVDSEDWGALLDVVPTMSTVFWLLTLLSIGLNIMPIFLDLKNKK